jgi:hypothetical protein
MKKATLKGSQFSCMNEYFEIAVENRVGNVGFEVVTPVVMKSCIFLFRRGEICVVFLILSIQTPE